MAIGTNAPLSPRQVLAYEQRVHLYRPTIVQQGNRKLPGPYEPAYEDVPCHREPRDSTSTPTLMGRTEADNQFSLDTFHFAEKQEIDEGWIIYDVSLRPDGTPADDSTYHKFWICRGEAKGITESVRRRSGKKAMTASREPNAPVGLV